MGQDWPKGDEPACGDFAARFVTVVLAIAALLTVLALAAACSDPVCSDPYGRVGDIRQDLSKRNTFYVCGDDGKWHKAANPFPGAT